MEPLDPAGAMLAGLAAKGEGTVPAPARPSVPGPPARRWQENARGRQDQFALMSRFAAKRKG